MEGFSLIYLGLFSVLVLPTFLDAITTIHHDKPEESKISSMVTKMAEKPTAKTKISFNLTQMERQKRLLPYENFYLTEGLNTPIRNSFPNGGQRYQFDDTARKNALNNRQQYHKYELLNYQPSKPFKDQPHQGAGTLIYQNGRFTPFMESNAIPGPFTPMLGSESQRPQRVKLQLVPVAHDSKLPNFSAIYDKLSQLKLAQDNRPLSALGHVQNYRPQQQEHYHPKPQHVTFIPTGNNYEQPVVYKPKTIIETFTATDIDVTAAGGDGYNRQYVGQIPKQYTRRPNKPYVQVVLESPPSNYENTYEKQPVRKPIIIVQQKPIVNDQPKTYHHSGENLQSIPINKPVIYFQRKPNYQTRPVTEEKYTAEKYVSEKYVPIKYDLSVYQKYPVPKYEKEQNYVSPKYEEEKYVTPKYEKYVEEKYVTPNNEKYVEEKYVTPKYEKYVEEKYVTPKYENNVEEKYVTPKYENNVEEKYVTPKYENNVEEKYVTPKYENYVVPETPRYEETLKYPQNQGNEQDAHKYEEFHPQRIEYKPEPVTENSNNLNSILKHLQDSNTLPHTITSDNIDNSIKTLVKILGELRKQQKSHKPIIAADDLDDEYSLPIEGDHDDGSQSYPLDTVEGGTPGKPGIDYPALSTIPKTNFNCKTQRYKGFFGDPDTNCQVWHYCDLNGGQASFLCPNGTIFSQVALTCDWWYNVKCASTAQLYVLNERLYKYILPLSPKFPEDYSGPLVDKYLALKFQEMEEKMKKEKKGKEEDKEKESEELQDIDDQTNEENAATTETPKDTLEETTDEETQSKEIDKK